jgi:hypothetical protein
VYTFDYASFVGELSDVPGSHSWRIKGLIELLEQKPHPAVVLQAIQKFKYLSRLSVTDTSSRFAQPIERLRQYCEQLALTISRPKNLSQQLHVGAEYEMRINMRLVDKKGAFLPVHYDAEIARTAKKTAICQIPYARLSIDGVGSDENLGILEWQGGPFPVSEDICATPSAIASPS